MDYFTGKRLRIVASGEPSFVRAELGSWISFLASANAKREVEATIRKRNGGSFVYLNFNFMKEYVSGFGGAILGAIIVSAFILWSPNFMIPPGYTFTKSAPTVIKIIALTMATIVLVSVMSLEAWHVSRTRKKFVEEFNVFIDSLQTKTSGKNE